MKNEINYKVNIDNVKKFIYNITNEEIFTYSDYLKYKKLFNSSSYSKYVVVKENSGEYEYPIINNEHDKMFRKILDNKKEAVILINKALKINIKESEIEKYKENYVTEILSNKETDIVYKIKDRNVFFLIEHQTKIDYSMAYRIAEYEQKIIDSAIDKKRVKQKDYVMPIVIPIVLYTGKKKWNASLYIKEIQEIIFQYNGYEIGRYTLVDVNNYTNEELLEEKTFLSKAMVLEKINNNKELVKYLEIIINLFNNDKTYIKEQRDLLKIMLDLLLRGKIEDNSKVNELINKINVMEEKNMLTCLETIKKDNKRIRIQAKREGAEKKKREIAKKMKERNMPIDEIEEITGLTIKQIEKL